MSTTCLCPRCRPEDPPPARGTPEFLYSDLHRRECEAREVLKLSKEARTRYYRSVHEARGEYGCYVLIYDVEKLYKERVDAAARADHAA